MDTDQLVENALRDPDKVVTVDMEEDDNGEPFLAISITTRTVNIALEATAWAVGPA
mgnify:CR=1 FL=1